MDVEYREGINLQNKDENKQRRDALKKKLCYQVVFKFYICSEKLGNFETGMTQIPQVQFVILLSSLSFIFHLSGERIYSEKEKDRMKRKKDREMESLDAIVRERPSYDGHPILSSPGDQPRS